jgi:hypothetical protein
VAKLPEPPSVAMLRRDPPAVATLQAGTKLWRIYFRDGKYPSTWDQMRHYGPVGNARFDHHLDPPRAQDRGILYAATGDDAIATCLAEVFQDTRLVDTRRNEPWLAAFTLLEDVSLIDLSGKWPTVAGVSANINSGPRPRCRRWSRTICYAYPNLMGMYYASSMNGNEPALALSHEGTSALASPQWAALRRTLAYPHREDRHRARLRSDLKAVRFASPGIKDLRTWRR